MRLDSAKVRELLDQMSYTAQEAADLTSTMAPETGDYQTLCIRPSELVNVLDTGGSLTERQATTLATVLGVGLSELLPAGDERKLAWVGEQLAELQHRLDDIGAALGYRSDYCPSCGSGMRARRLPARGGPDECVSPWHLLPDNRDGA